MIKKTHPADRAERRKLKEIYDEKKHGTKAEFKRWIKDQETQDELRRGKSLTDINGQHPFLD
jgi:hypothetical protein